MNPIVKDIEQVVDELRELLGNDADGPPYYLYGHRVEMAKKLTGTHAGKNKINTVQRYPAILLRMDLSEVKHDGLVTYDLNLAILDYTKEKYDADQRYSNVILPILYPLYEKFMQVLSNSGLFMWEGDREHPTHEKVDRPYWGTYTLEGNEKKLFTDPIDAIEILNLKVSKLDCLENTVYPSTIIQDLLSQIEALELEKAELELENQELRDLLEGGQPGEGIFDLTFDFTFE